MFQIRLCLNVELGFLSFRFLGPLIFQQIWQSRWSRNWSRTTIVDTAESGFSRMTFEGFLGAAWSWKKISVHLHTEMTSWKMMLQKLQICISWKIILFTRGSIRRSPTTPSQAFKLNR